MAAVRIDTSFNLEGLKKGWSVIEKNVRNTENVFGKMGDSISKSFGETTTAIMKQQIAISNLAEKLKEVQEIETQRIDYERQTQEVDKLVKEFGDLSEEATKARIELSKMEFPLQPKENSEQLTLKLALANKRLREMKEKGEETGNVVEKSTNKMSDGFTKLATRIKNLVVTVAVFQTLRTAIRSLTQGLGNALMKNDEFAGSLNAIKVNLLTAFAPIWETIQPILISFMKVLQQVTYYAAKFVATLFGKTLDQAKSSAKALYGQAKAIKEVKKAADSANNSLEELTFINKTLDETAKDTSGLDFSELAEFEPNEKIEGFFDGIAKAIENLKPLLKDAYDWFTDLDDGIKVGLLATLGGLVAILFGPTGLGWALVGVGLLIMGLSEIFSGDGSLSKNIKGIIYTLGGAGLIGILVGKGGLGLAIGGVIVIISGLADIMSGDLDRAITGIIKIIVGSAGLIIALGLMKGGFASINVPLLITVFAVGALALGITSLIKNWENMTPLQRAITIFGSLAAAGLAAAAAIAIFHTSWSVGLAAAAIVAGLGLLAGSMLFSKKSPVATFEGANAGSLSAAQSFGATNFSSNPLPKLATGNVFMPNKEMEFIAGDHPTQREILAPEDLIRQIVREESGNNGNNEEVINKLDQLITAINNLSIYNSFTGNDLLTAVEGAEASRGIQSGGVAFRNAR